MTEQPPLAELARQVRALAELPPSTRETTTIAQVGQVTPPLQGRDVWLVSWLNGWPYLVRMERGQERRAWFLAADTMIQPTTPADVAALVDNFNTARLRLALWR